ncbi:SGNH/GDSL hydrolase family protein [Amnibacterium setariae]|uniref:SGNH/GDSL hydrolase family protein n=2 Tax=Amnibacterium setariae TaxID=2306585 RepID=A0A3A1TV88_9MICO|nr:SGNH/GDSL hydrolase family protein [Amnibacterium setariae]
MTRRGALLAGATSIAAIGGAGVVSRELFVLGDSWAAGLYADPAAALGQIASARLGWDAAVDAVSGTGYVNGAATKAAYPDRARALPLDVRATIAVVQGGSNDKASTARDVADGAHETLAVLRERLPAARLVLLGPGPDPLPVTADQRAVDRVLHRVAGQEGVPYVSILRQRWIAPERADLLLDPGTHHPTVVGQAYLGHRLAAALRRLYPRLTA